MITSLQRLSVSFWAALRQGLGWLGHRVHSTPWLSGWVYAPLPQRNAEAEYRDYNGWIFGSFDAQERMLADGPRMRFFHALIRGGVQAGDRVIDLGTGTGVLAAWASRAGAAQVWALDHSAILETAKKVAAANAVENLTFVATHSTDFKLPERVDVIVHEQMGDFLFDEGMVANVCDLRDRLLKPGGRILPSRFEWFCEPVMVRAERRAPFIWELNAHGYDYACLKQDVPEDPEYFRQASADLGLVERFLGAREAAITFDLETIEGVAALPRRLGVTREVQADGQLDALAVFFEVNAEGGLKLSSSPLDAGRAPHWAYRLLRVPQQAVTAGDSIEISLEIGRWADPDSWQWWVNVRRPEVVG